MTSSSRAFRLKLRRDEYREQQRAAILRFCEGALGDVQEADDLRTPQALRPLDDVRGNG
jgi:hypothetical protein